MIPAARHARLPAWIASLGLHLVLLVAILAFVRSPGGNEQEEPFREVGIVVREASVEPFDTFEPTEINSENSSENTNNDQAESSSESAAIVQPPSPFANLLSELASQANDNLNSNTEADQPSGKPIQSILPPGQVRVSVFGVEGTGSRFVYAFDRSISMRGPPLASAKRQLVASLESMQSVNQFQILFFNHRLSAFDLTGGQHRVAFATAENKERARKYVSRITADGSTDRYAALAKALSFGPDAIFFLSDADSPMTPGEVSRIIKRSGAQGSTINTIEFGNGPQRKESNFLIEIAVQTGGQHGYVDTLRLGR